MTPQNDLITIPTIEDLTRREFMSSALAAALLIACGEDEDKSPSSSTITVANQFGTFQVPVEPQRVIGWEGRRDLETALALQLSPIAIGSNALSKEALAPFLPAGFNLNGVEIITQTEPDLERITFLEPDLILTRDDNISPYVDQLRTLAPLVPVRTTGPWRSDLEEVAAALGRSRQAAEVLTTYDKLRDEIRDRHAQRIKDATIAVFSGLPASGFVSSNTRGFFLQVNTLGDLGGNNLPFFEASTEDRIRISAEQLREVAEADAILLLQTAEFRAPLDEFPLWQGLPAVRAGRVVMTDPRTNYGSVYAAMECLRLLDQVYNTLT